MFRLFLLLVLTGMVVAQQCETCSDKSQCCGDTQCCGGGSECCTSTELCCGSICCAGSNSTLSTEICCPDPHHGDVCCDAQTSQCCPPIPGRMLPSRCCPSWMVCCLGGRDGCCDPAELMGDVKGDSTVTFLAAWGGNGELYAYTVSASSGDVLSSKAIPDFPTHSDLVRPFVWDAKVGLYYTLIAAYETGVVTLYTVDPVSAKAYASPVTNLKVRPHDVVVSYTLASEGTLTATTLSYGSDAASTPTGYTFHVVDVKSSTAVSSCTQSVAVMPGSSGVVSNWTYAGYMSLQDPSSGSLLRLGYHNAATSETFGLGTTHVSVGSSSTCSNASSTFVPLDLAAASVDQLYTLAVGSVKDGVNHYVSVGSHSLDYSGPLSLVQWSVKHNAFSPDFSVALGDAYEPLYFGSVMAATAGDLGYVLAVSESDIDKKLDRLELIEVDLGTGTVVVSTDLSPFVSGLTNGLCGMGIIS